MVALVARKARPPMHTESDSPHLHAIVLLCQSPRQCNHLRRVSDDVTVRIAEDTLSIRRRSDVDILSPRLCDYRSSVRVLVSRPYSRKNLLLLIVHHHAGLYHPYHILCEIVEIRHHPLVNRLSVNLPGEQRGDAFPFSAEKFSRSESISLRVLLDIPCRPLRYFPRLFKQLLLPVEFVSAPVFPRRCNDELRFWEQFFLYSSFHVSESLRPFRRIFSSTSFLVHKQQ